MRDVPCLAGSEHGYKGGGIVGHAIPHRPKLLWGNGAHQHARQHRLKDGPGLPPEIPNEAGSSAGGVHGHLG